MAAQAVRTRGSAWRADAPRPSLGPGVARALPKHMTFERSPSPAASVSSGTFGTTDASTPAVQRMNTVPTGWEFYGRAFDDLVTSISALPTPPRALVARLLAFCPSSEAVDSAGPHHQL